METAKPGHSSFNGFLKTVKKLVLSNNNTNMKKKKREKTLHSLLSELFLSVSSIKASYAELQLAESPLNLETIQSADHAIISELNHLSLLKHSYHTHIIPQSSHHLAELQEQKNLIKIFRITVKKLQSELLERETQIVNLQEHRFLFPAAIQDALSAASSFAREMFSQTEFAGWDLQEAVSAMDLTVLPEHKVFACESFVSSAIFSGFHLPDLDEFEEFCRTRYRRTVHPSLEETFSPSCKTEIISRFVEMAKKVWILHRIFFSSFGEEEERGIFKVGNGCRFSEVFMERVVEMEDGGGGAAVGFTVAPGFCLGKMVIVRCKVYPSLR